jgi:hypothetical protein
MISISKLLIDNQVLDQFPEIAEEFILKEQNFKIAISTGINQEKPFLITIFLFVIKNGLTEKVYSIKKMAIDSKIEIKEVPDAQDICKFEQGWVRFNYLPEIKTAI